MTASHSKCWRILRRCLVGLAVLLTLIATFYTEENWRGKRAWENCKRELEAKGIKMDWTNSIPAPVPDDQNVFAVPEMRQWFLGKGPTVLSARLGDIEDLYDAGDTTRPSTRIVVAEVAISQPDSNSPAGFTVLTYGDPKTKAEVDKLIKDAFELLPVMASHQASMQIVDQDRQPFMVVIQHLNVHTHFTCPDYKRHTR